MSSTVSARSFARPILTDRRVLLLYAVTIFTSAFMLFAVQPIFAKMMLPTLGGAPAVWAVSMCFFQAALLGGYCYAHFLNRFAPARSVPLIHLAVLATAALALPFGLPTGLQPPENPSYIWMMGTLAAGVGLPFFAISANAPLLQAWFSRTGHPHATDPYFLYGASNVGSLLALLAYPFAVEPWIGLQAQASVWTAGYVVLVVLIGMSAVAMLTLASVTTDIAETDAVTAEPVTWNQRATWIGLSFVPSGLLVAVTTHISTDIVSMPLLWVIPLAVYLITFMLAFRETPMIPDRWLSIASAPLVAATVLISLISAKVPVAIHFGLVFSSFFVLVVMNHRELYRHRPGVSRLTEFYLWMSFGGVLGGMACSLLAPQIFNSVLEYPLLLVAALAGQAAFLSSPTPEQRDARTGLLVVTVGLLAVALFVSAMFPGAVQSTSLLLIFVIGGIVGSSILCKSPKLAIIPCAAMVAGVAAFPIHASLVTQQRSFFGVVAVQNVDDKRVMTLGTTAHGAERLADLDDNLSRPLPLTYYHPENPMPKGLELARDLSPDPKSLRVGIVGLGVGAMACNGRTGERWRFYEIDKLVIDIASDPRYFTYLSKCPVSDGIKLGDARLTVQQEHQATFDYLLIDAFSSDVVPAHLLTLEAITMYIERVKPTGILALHVSSRLLDLEDVAAATSSAVPNVRVAVVSSKKSSGSAGLEKTRSTVVFVTRSDEAARRLQGLDGFVSPRTNGIAPWTDDYSDILGSIIRFQQK